MLILRVLLTLMTVFANAAGFASGGAIHSGGGGDPEAVEYVAIMREVSELVRLIPSIREVVTAEAFAKLAESYRASLNDDDIGNDLVVFSDAPVIYNGVAKAAAFDGKRAIVNRRLWLEYKQQKLKGRQRAIVLLEGMLALGIPVGRYSAAEALLPVDAENVDDYMTLLQLGESSSATQKTCDYLIRLKNQESSEYTIDFYFSWRLGDRAYMLGYLASAETNSGQLPLIKTYSSRAEKTATAGEHIVHHKMKQITATREGFRLADASRSVFVQLQADGTRDTWEYRNGAKGAHLGRDKDQVLKNYQGNSTLLSSEGETEAGKITRSCKETPVSAEWSAILAQPKLAAEIAKFDDFAKRVANAEVGYQLCLNRRGLEACTDAKLLAQTLASRAEAQWATLNKSLGAIFKESYSRAQVPQRDLGRCAGVDCDGAYVRVVSELDRIRVEDRAKKLRNEYRQLQEQIKSRKNRRL